MSCRSDYIDNGYKAMMALITRGVFEPISPLFPPENIAWRVSKAEDTSPCVCKTAGGGRLDSVVGEGRNWVGICFIKN